MTLFTARAISWESFPCHLVGPCHIMVLGHLANPTELFSDPRVERDQ
jgi:hypothetical protein